MTDETTLAETIDLGVRCEQCDTWYTVHIARGRLVDMRETTCPQCGGSAFQVTPEGMIVPAEMRH